MIYRVLNDFLGKDITSYFLLKPDGSIVIDKMNFDDIDLERMYKKLLKAKKIKEIGLFKFEDIFTEKAIIQYGFEHNGQNYFEGDILAFSVKTGTYTEKNRQIFEPALAIISHNGINFDLYAPDSAMNYIGLIKENGTISKIKIIGNINQYPELLAK